MKRRNQALLVELSTGRKATAKVAKVIYDEGAQMSRMRGSTILAIDYRGPQPPRTKKADLERGEDQKERW